MEILQENGARTKIYSVTYLVETLCGAGIAFLISRLLGSTNTATTFVILGCVYAFVFVILLHKMKSHVGLKPEEYDKNDIDLMDLH